MVCDFPEGMPVASPKSIPSPSRPEEQRILSLTAEIKADLGKKP
jgi:hypothetical protein